MYLFREGPKSRKPRVQLLGSGTILREVIAAADLLTEDWGVAADIWSVTSFTELRCDGIQAERWNMLHPTAEPRRPYVLECLDGRRGPVIASTDYIRAFADQIRQWVPAPYQVLGTDGFGRSDYRYAALATAEDDDVMHRRAISIAGNRPWPRRISETVQLKTNTLLQLGECRMWLWGKHRGHLCPGRMRRSIASGVSDVDWVGDDVLVSGPASARASVVVAESLATLSRTRSRRSAISIETTLRSRTLNAPPTITSMISTPNSRRLPVD